MRDVEVIDRPQAAAAALEPFRARLLAELAEPASATQLGERLGVARQRVNYHLRTLEEQGLVHTVEERPRRGLTERIVQASAASYVVSTAALGAAAPEPARTRDRLSASYLIAVAARTVREVGDLARRADDAGRSLATMTIDSDIRFASADDRAAFTAEFTDAITQLMSRYHTQSSPGGRWHRLNIAAYPRPAAAAAAPSHYPEETS